MRRVPGSRCDHFTFSGSGDETGIRKDRSDGELASDSLTVDSFLTGLSKLIRLPGVDIG